MAEPTLDQVGKWILDNQDKAGTPDYVMMAQQYRDLSSAQPPAMTEDQATAPVGGAYRMNVNRAAPVDLAARRADEDPYSLGNTTDRVITGAAAGIPDLGIAGYNAMARAIGDKEVPYIAPQLRANVGGKELPPDASNMRRILEGAGSAAVGGGGVAAARAAAAAPSLLRMVPDALRSLATTSLVPSVTGSYGGQVAEATLGKIIDPETANLIGSLAGGGAPGAAAPARRSLINRSYQGRGAPNAAETAAAAERANIPITPGTLGDQSVRNLEQTLQRKPGTASVVRDARNDMFGAMREGVADVANQRGTVTTDNPSVIGQNINELANDATASAVGRASEVQNRIRDRVGPETPVSAWPIIQSAIDLYRNASNVTERGAITGRMQSNLNPLLSADEAGRPVLNAGGEPTMPFRSAQGFSKELGRSIDNGSGGRLPPLKQLYPATRETLLQGADAVNMPRQDMVNSSNRWRDTMALRDELEPMATREPRQAYSYLEGGETNPARLQALEAGGSGDPRLGNIMASHIAQIGNTLPGAQGPINFAKRIERMNPESLDIIAQQGAGRLRDIAHVARETNRPTEQGGASAAGMDIMQGASSPVAGALGAGATAAATGILPSWLAGAIGYMGPRYIDRARQRALFSDSARRGMLGQPEPSLQRPEMADLIARLNAIGAVTQ